MLHLIVFHWVAHLPHTCTFSYRRQNGITLTDTPQPKSLPVSHFASYRSRHVKVLPCKYKTKSPKCNRYKWIVFLTVGVIWRVIPKFFQQSDLFEDSAVAKLPMGPGSPSCAHDASLLQPWIYCWNTKREKTAGWTSLPQTVSSRKFAKTVYKVAVYGWKRKL